MWYFRMTLYLKRKEKENTFLFQEGTLLELYPTGHKTILVIRWMMEERVKEGAVEDGDSRQ